MKISTALMPEDKLMFIPNGIKGCLSIYIPSSNLNLWPCLKIHKERKSMLDYELKGTHSAGMLEFG